MLLLLNTNTLDDSQQQLLSDTFVVDAIYFEKDRIIEITFHDTTGKSDIVVLEILGMAESFQRLYYNTSSITERVSLPQGPSSQFGWKVNPVTFVVTHKELGVIGIKTEIHGTDQPKPLVIYSDYNK